MLRLFTAMDPSNFFLSLGLFFLFMLLVSFLAGKIFAQQRGRILKSFLSSGAGWPGLSDQISFCMGDVLFRVERQLFERF